MKDWNLPHKPSRAAALLHLAAFLLVGLPSPCFAWTLPEHAYISANAAQSLSSPPVKTWSALWGLMLTQYGGALPLNPDWRAEPAANRPDAYDRVPSAVKSLSFGDLPALAADHSCSPSELAAVLGEMGAVLRAPPVKDRPHWLQRVIVDAAYSYSELVKLGGFPLTAPVATNARRDDNRDDLNFDLTIHDKAYVDRASANYAHFQLPRSSDTELLEEWLNRMTSDKTELANAAAYGTYHALALAGARDFHNTFGSPVNASQTAEAAKLALDIVLNEVFALHFLEDAFAAGHFTDFRRESSLRNGIHDAYSRNGSQANAWAGANWKAHGDGHMGSEDVDKASIAIHVSLLQIHSALESGMLPPGISALVAESVDVCTEQKPRYWLATLSSTSVFAALSHTPQPTVSGGEGLPAYRNDRGINVQVGIHGNSSLLIGHDATFATSALGELGLALNFDSLMAAYRDGNIFQFNLLGGVENTFDHWRSVLGFHARVPWAALVWSSFRVALSDSIQTSVLQYAAMAETRPWSWAPGPWTSALTLNKLSDFSMLWSENAWTIRIPIIYYQVREPRPLESAWEPYARVELGANIRVGHDGNFYGAYVDVAPMVRGLLTNLGPK